MQPISCFRTPLDFALIAATLLGLGFVGGQLAVARSDRPDVETVLTTSLSVGGEVIQYPAAQPAKITAIVVTLKPGQHTGWHRHGVPTFGYILEGEIEVDYGPRGRKTFRTGDALMEAMAHAHIGRNVSDKRVRVLAVSIGAKGVAISTPAGANLAPKN